MFLILENIKNYFLMLRVKNRRKRSQFKLFLIWLTLIIVVTFVFYFINNYYNVNSLETYSNKIIKTTSEPIESNNIYPKQNPIQLNDITPKQNPLKLDNISTNVNNLNESKKLVENFKETNLYNQILNDVANIPKPLSFVDNYNFEF